MPVRLEEYGARLKQLPFVHEAAFVRPDGAAAALGFDAILRLHTVAGEKTFVVESKSGHLGYAIVNAAIHRARQFGHYPLLICAPHVPPPLVHHIIEQGAAFIDLAGNCHLEIGENYVASVEGRKPVPRPKTGRAFRTAGYQVMFAILAEPSLVGRSVRALATLAGAGKTATAETIAQLAHEGLIGKTRKGRIILHRKRLLDKWLHGYSEVLRPAWTIGRYRMAEKETDAVERQIRETLGNSRWAWGGAAAAMRLTQYYRGPETVVHVWPYDETLPRRVRAIPDADGPVTILETPFDLAFKGAVPETAHPLLVYAELLSSGDERERNTAEVVRDQFLGDLL